MPANRNALIRYKTIDKCLSNPYRKWSLNDLIEACSDALYDYEGIDKGVSRRTIQGDIQIMRSDKLGYNAPIEVYENKFYRYADRDYTITKMPVSQQDLDKLSEAMGILKQFKNFSHFQELTGMVQKLEDKIHSERNQKKSVIILETNEQVKGLQHLDDLYKAIINKKGIAIKYKSFKARKASEIGFSPYLLREYRNRWFLVGKKNDNEGLVNLALDRIIEIKQNNNADFEITPGFNPSTYYQNTIGVTVINQRPKNVHIWVDPYNAPYVITKPLHPSQEIISTSKQGIEIKIKVHLNYELEREILGFGKGMKVISPKSFANKIKTNHQSAFELYQELSSKLKPNK